MAKPNTGEKIDAHPERQPPGLQRGTGSRRRSVASLRQARLPDVPPIPADLYQYPAVFGLRTLSTAVVRFGYRVSLLTVHHAPVRIDTRDSCLKGAALLGRRR